MIGQDETQRSGKTASATALGIIRTANDADWMNVLAQSVQHDFYHLPGYHRLAEHRGEGTAFLFTYREGRYLIALPLLLRPVDEEDPAGRQDATSVYGYCGPIASHERIPKQVIRNFHATLREELVDRRVVTVFSRLHPLIAQEELLLGLGETCAVGRTVSVDLTLPLQDQWARYGKKCRRVIDKAREAGVICIHDRERSYRREWVEIYQDTMRRVNAPNSYFLDEEYFELLAHELGAVLQLFVAIVDGSVAAAGLYTICDGIAQAHLGGMRREYMSCLRRVSSTTRRGSGHMRAARGCSISAAASAGRRTPYSNTRRAFRTDAINLPRGDGSSRPRPIESSANTGSVSMNGKDSAPWRETISRPIAGRRSPS